MRKASISACQQGGQWELAVDMLRNMLQDDMQPDVISFSASITACEKAGEWQLALELLAQMSVAKISANAVSGPALEIFGNRLQVKM